MGADVVVGHHPHVPENYEVLENGKIIFYSLGNFIFDTNYQREHLYTDIGVLLKLKFTEEKVEFEAVGIQIIRGDERIDTAPLPDIFTNIPAEEFERLAPLAAKAFVLEEQRKMIFLKPQRFGDFTQADWDKYFATETSDSFCAGAHQDFRTIVPYSLKADAGQWKQSKLEKVRNYILRQFE
ncbi:MAG: CapA family protein [Oscillospiraceae bacterium]|nr:CapA family protein [Oscillospiraceae bacterium]